MCLVNSEKAAGSGHSSGERKRGSGGEGKPRRVTAGNDTQR